MARKTVLEKHEINSEPREVEVVNVNREPARSSTRAVANQPVSGKGGTVFLIAGVLFVGYLYLSKRLVAVYRAIRYGTQQIPVMMGQMGGGGNVTPFVPDNTQISPIQPPILPQVNPPLGGGQIGKASIPYKNNPNRRVTVYFVGQRACRVILHDTMLRLGYTEAEAQAAIAANCNPMPGGSLPPGVMIP